MPPRKKATKRARKRRSPAQKPLLEPSTLDQIDEAVALLEGKAKKKPGRPTVPDNILRGRRQAIAHLFEVNWAYIGWQIQCLRNPGDGPASSDDVRKAFEPLQGQSGGERIGFLLRATSLPASSDDVRKTLGELDDAQKHLSDVQQAYDAQAKRFTQARGAVQEATQKHKGELQREITRRIRVRIQLKSECTAKERLVAAARKAVAHASPGHLDKAKGELSKSRMQFEQCKESVQTEEKIIDGLKARLTAATRANWLLAREEKKKRLRRLKELKANLKTQRNEVERLNSLYLDQAAGFARGDLLEFFVKRQPRHDPRTLANAIAGLPEMGCRASSTRCEAIPFDNAPHTDFQAFEVIARAWERRVPGKPRPLMELIGIQLKTVPKNLPFHGERVPNYLHQYFHDNQRDLEQAIDSCRGLRPRPPTGQVPYIVTARFLKNMSRPKTNLERVLLNQGSKD
jgi:hypothetical protein